MQFSLGELLMPVRQERKNKTPVRKYEVRSTKYEVKVRSSFLNDYGRLLQQTEKVNDHCFEITTYKLHFVLRTSYLVLSYWCFIFFLRKDAQFSVAGSNFVD